MLLGCGWCCVDLLWKGCCWYVNGWNEVVEGIEELSWVVEFVVVVGGVL